MKRPTLGQAAWLAIGGYELLCPPRQMLCEVLDPMIARWPWIMRAIIFYTALHVANLLPGKIDLYYQTAVGASRLRKRITHSLLYSDRTVSSRSGELNGGR